MSPFSCLGSIHPATHNSDSNCQNREFDHVDVSDFNHSTPSRTDDLVVVPTVWGILVFVGVIGNFIVVYVMIRHGDRNATNYYVINLALTDLAFTVIVIPLTMIHYVSQSWILGLFACRFLMYTTYVLLFATCLTLSAMTLDRYFSILYPIKSLPHRTPKVALVVSVISWIVSLVLSIPFALYHDLVTVDYYGPRCKETWASNAIGQTATAYVICVTYVFPLGVIVVCYARILRHLWKKQAVLNKAATLQSTTSSSVIGSIPSFQQLHSVARRRKAAKMVAVIVVLFAAFWFPIHAFQIWFKFDETFPRTELTYIYKIFAHTLSYANSCVNPFVYCFLGDGFRKALARTCPRLFGTNKVHPMSLPVISGPSGTGQRLSGAESAAAKRSSSSFPGRTSSLRLQRGTSRSDKKEDKRRTSFMAPKAAY